MTRKFILLFFISFNVFAFDIDETMTGSWFDQNNSGQGINIEVLSGNRMLVYWYAYDNGQPLWLTGVGSYSGDTAEIELSQFDGSEFGVNHNVSLVSSKVFGSLTITIDSCDSGSMTYNSIQGMGSGSINLNRLTNVLGIQCTTPSTPTMPFSQNTIDLNGLRFSPRTCDLVGDKLTCEFTVTALTEDINALLSPSNVNINGTVFISESVSLGSSTSSLAGRTISQLLTKGVPVIGKVIFEGIPVSTRTLNLLQLRAQNFDLFVLVENIDFFDAVVVNNN